MDKIKKNNNGAALIIALGVLLFLSVLGSAIFLRYASEHVLSQREKGLTQAFYNAEEGIHYAYAELNQHNFDWNTHTWSGTTSLIKNTVTSSLIGSGYEGKFNTDGSYYMDETLNPHYFKVVVYPELNKDTGVATGIIVIHSQGTDPKATAACTLELRVNKNSMFNYFYFFPSDHTFSGGTYDGAGYGKIHVNGMIIFAGGSTSTIFKNIVELSTADSGHRGYYSLYNWKFSSPYSYDSNNTTIDGIASLPKNDTPPYDYSLSSTIGYNTRYHFNSNYLATTYCATVDGVPLPVELSTTWSWDKYDGTKSSSEVPIAFKIDNPALAWLAYKKGSGNFLNSTDYATFSSSPSTFNWETWKTNNGYTSSDTDTTGALARKFWETWQGTNPSYINSEWWTDLTYGDDRSAGDYIDVPFLNTKEQSTDWLSWLNSKTATIKKTDTEETTTTSLNNVIKDSSNGASYMTAIGLDNDSYKNKAQDGGLYISNGYTTAYQNWEDTVHTVTLLGEYTISFTFGDQDDPIFDLLGTIPMSDFFDLLDAYWDAYTALYAQNPPPQQYEWNTTAGDLEEGQVVNFSQFYNILHPAKVTQEYSTGFSTSNAGKTKIMEIDVAQLRQYLTQNNQPFNGVIYIESANSNDIAYDFSVFIKNAGILPENGLTVVTPHNIYVAGSFNLDHQRDGETAAYSAYKEAHGGASSEYTWKPAALISTNRAIYTVSDYFQPYISEISSLFGISSYNYWESFSSYNYASSLKNSNFLNNYLNNVTKETALAYDTDGKLVKYCNDYGINIDTLPWGTWTANLINTYFNPTNPGAGNAQAVLLNAGEGKYDSATETTQPNRVYYDVIYNTAMVSPYEPQGYTLERWIGADGAPKTRTIVGSFIQLAEEKRLPIPLAYYKHIYDENGTFVKSYYDVQYGYPYQICYSDGRCIRKPDENWWEQYTNYAQYGYFAKGYVPYYSSYYNPSSTYGYEINFGKENSASGSTFGLSASGINSWLQIPNSDFCSKCSQ